MAETDPNCAMAQWGIAMTWWHPIWTSPTPEEMKAGTAAIDKATALKPPSERERRFIAALHAYYHAADTAAATGGPAGLSCHGPGGSRERALNYEEEMDELAEKYPDDMEAQTFHALALLAVGYATPNDTTLSKQLEATRILETLRTKMRIIPGSRIT